MSPETTPPATAGLLTPELAASLRPVRAIKGTPEVAPPQFRYTKVEELSFTTRSQGKVETYNLGPHVHCLARLLGAKLSGNLGYLESSAAHLCLQGLAVG